MIHLPCCDVAVHPGCVEAGCPFCSSGAAALDPVQVCVECRFKIEDEPPVFSCCSSAWHLRCLAPRACAAQPELADCVVCTEAMTMENSIEVLCCRQFVHVVCLARSFSSRGVDWPFCNQSLAEFARSSSFMASSLFHGCMVDLDRTPSNLGLNSMVLPNGFPRPPDSLAVLCCPRLGPPPRFEELSDRRMEWSPSHHAISDQWSPQWICVRCSRSVGLQDIPSRPTSHCPQCSDSNLTFVLDCSSNVHWTWCCQ